MREGDIKEGKTWDGSGIRGKSHSTSVTGDVSIVFTAGFSTTEAKEPLAHWCGSFENLL